MTFNNYTNLSNWHKCTCGLLKNDNYVYAINKLRYLACWINSQDYNLLNFNDCNIILLIIVVY